MNAEKRFLEKLFFKLKNSTVVYAVMRNYEQLPDSAGGSDLDILISEGDRQLFKSILYETVYQSGGVLIGCSYSYHFFNVFILGKNQDDSSLWWGLRIDVNCGVYFKGIQQIAEESPWPVARHRGISVLPVGLAGVLGVLKEVLNNNQVSERYVGEAKEAVAKDWVEVESFLSPIGDVALDRFRKLLFSYSTNENLSRKCGRIRRALLWHALATRPWQSLCGWLSFECSKVNRYVWPSGVVVAILGVDGVGKSTVINGILPVLNEATHNAVSCQHLRPGLLPPLARLKGKTAVPAAPVLDPHGATPSGTLGSLLRLSYLTLDYILGYWFKIRLIIAKQPTVVLYDRYAYDMVIDPRRFRIGVSGRLASLFTRLAPRPHLIICLHAEPEVVAARKEELPLNEIHRQIDALKQFAASQPGAVLVSTNGSPEIVRDRVLQAFMDFLSTRNQNI